MSSPYSYSYGPTQYEGTINGIEVRWQPVGQKRLHDQAGILKVPEETLKKMCEHFSYLLAYRLGSSRVVIKTGPHSFSIDSQTGKRSDDGDHFSVEVSGGPYGRRKAHVYLQGHGFGVGAYDNIGVSAESVMDKKGKSIDTGLSTGNPSLASSYTVASGAEAGGSSYNTTAGNAGSGGTAWEGYEAGASSGTTTSGAGAWGSTYTTTGGGSGQESASGEWVWSPEYGMYYHSGTGEWAPPQQ